LGYGFKSHFRQYNFIMIIIGTKLLIVDNSGGKIAKCIRIIEKGKKKFASVGNTILVSLVKFINKKKVKKRVIYIGLIIGIKYWVCRMDGTYIKFFSNSILLFNKQSKFLGTRIYGILLKEVKIKTMKDKKNRTYFHKIISYSSFII
jgi:large subunit ribosomal protein L14